MNLFNLRSIGTVGMMSVMGTAMAADASPAPVPQEPAGFIAGGIVGGFAAGPVGAIIGAGIGTWLGNRVHRAGEARQAQAQVAALTTENAALLSEKQALIDEEAGLSQTNQTLARQIESLSQSVQAAENSRSDAATVLDGLQGDGLFRTGSAEITEDLQHQIQVLAQAVARAPQLTVRVDGYADPRGTVDENLKLSEARADAVRDLFLAAGVGEQSLEINAYGKSKSTAADEDGYALERRVRLTLQAPGADAGEVAKTAAVGAVRQ
jgi:outer membrane protein OmpA-like peptidoglycan-associated protein